MNINSNNYSVAELVNMLDRRELLINSDYQRGSGLWPDGPSSYFIDTILENYPFPKIYLYEYLAREGARGMRKEIVDGQQRLKTITRYVNDEFAISGDSKFAGKRFSDLSPDEQEKFLSYPVSVDVIRSASRHEILQMFRRMNAYTLPLNEAEKRHSSFEGRFKWFVNNLSDSLSEFFVVFEVFTDRQILRMADAELITDSVLAIEDGIVSTSPTDLRSLYKKYEENFAESTNYTEKLLGAFGNITADFEALRGSYMMKPYALHSLLTALIHCRWGIPAITTLGVQPLGQFSIDTAGASNRLVALAQAHEAKETDGPHAKYVWGCAQGTNRVQRRTARVAAVLRALGADVPDAVDADIP